MAATVPEAYRDLLEGPVVVSFVTIMPNGQPQATPVWCDYDGTHVLINTTEGRQKTKNMQERPNVTVLAVDPKDNYRWIEIRGEIEEMTREGAVDLIDKLARVYTGHEKYYGGFAPAERANEETRLTVKIRPTHVVARG